DLRVEGRVAAAVADLLDLDFGVEVKNAARGGVRVPPPGVAAEVGQVVGPPDRVRLAPHRYRELAVGGVRGAQEDRHVLAPGGRVAGAGVDVLGEVKLLVLVGLLDVGEQQDQGRGQAGGGRRAGREPAADRMVVLAGDADLPEVVLAGRQGGRRADL